MKKMIIILMVVVVVIALSLTQTKECKAVDPITLTGFSIIIGVIGGSFWNYHKYPACRKAKSMAEMSDCIKAEKEKEKLEKEKKEN